MGYGTGRITREIRQFLYRLCLQEAVRHGGEQGVAPQFLELAVGRSGGHHQPDLPEQRATGHAGA